MMRPSLLEKTRHRITQKLLNFFAFSDLRAPHPSYNAAQRGPTYSELGSKVALSQASQCQRRPHFPAQQFFGKLFCSTHETIFHDLVWPLQQDLCEK